MYYISPFGILIKFCWLLKLIIVTDHGVSFLFTGTYPKNANERILSACHFHLQCIYIICVLCFCLIMLMSLQDWFSLLYNVNNSWIFYIASMPLFSWYNASHRLNIQLITLLATVTKYQKNNQIKSRGYTRATSSDKCSLCWQRHNGRGKTLGLWCQSRAQGILGG